MSLTKKTGITAASLVATVPVVFGGHTYLEKTYQPAGEYVTAGAFEQMSVDMWYGQYYDRLDDYDEAIAEGNEELAEEYKRQMERIKAKICKVDPDWERCD